jgi:hypothetical protein
MSNRHLLKQLTLLCGCALLFLQAAAQTDIDALMMNKNLFCAGPVYQHSTWKEYWEGTHKRDNKNLGTVTTQMLNVMGNYGISKKLNVLFNLPYVKTQASAGQLRGMKGVQDLSLWVKWLPLQQGLGQGTLSAFAIGGVSLPVSDYTPDFLPLSIGLGSKTASLRGLLDYERSNWFATGSATYYRRSNITLDREAYYTTEMHYTDEVKMPDAAQGQLRAGYRSSSLIAEAVLTHWATLGGFDITKNNMPFPSNDMDMTTAGVNAKYEFKNGLSLMGGGNYMVAGRNVGQSTSVYGGILYIFRFNKH